MATFYWTFCRLLFWWLINHLDYFVLTILNKFWILLQNYVECFYAKVVKLYRLFLVLICWYKSIWFMLPLLYPRLLRNKYKLWWCFLEIVIYRIQAHKHLFSLRLEHNFLASDLLSFWYCWLMSCINMQS